MRFAANDVAERTVVDPADEFHEGRAVANLEADVEAELAFGALADFNDAQRAGDVHSYRLFEIDMLTRSNGAFQVLRMIVGRRGDNDGIDFLGVRELLVSVGAEKKLRRVDGGVAFGLLELIEVGPCGIELIAEEVGQRDHARIARIDEIGRVFRAASAAAEQADPHSGVGRSAANQRRLDEHDARSSRRRF